MLSVKEYAARQSISVARVNQLIHSRDVRAEKIGSSWVIPESELNRKAPVSRPLSPDNAWLFIALISGQEPGDIDPKARWRLQIKRRLLAHDDDPAALLVSWLRKRAPVLSLRANPGDLSDLREDRRILLSGISDDRAGLSSGHEVEGYIDPLFARALKNEYLLTEAGNPNVWLHLTHVQPDKDGLAPLGLVLADLADHGGPREHQRVRELLNDAHR